MYHYHLDLLRATRNNILTLVQGCSLDQLNQVPDGYKNNLAWNLGHVLVTQQLLFYRLSGLEPYVNEKWIEQYRKGTRPMEVMDNGTLASIRTKLLSTVDLAQKDFETHRFHKYKPYTTSYGVILHSAEEAVIFNNMHEAMHLGFMIAMKKQL